MVLNKILILLINLYSYIYIYINIRRIHIINNNKLKYVQFTTKILDHS